MIPRQRDLLTDIEVSIGAAGGAARRPNQTPIPIRPKGSTTPASPDLDRPSIASAGPGEPCLWCSLCQLGMGNCMGKITQAS